MSAVSITRFLGEAPKLSGENLPETAAQYAYNTKLYSGDLIPYNKSSLDLALTKAGTIKTIYPMETSGTHLWLQWTTDVDVAKAPLSTDSTQRIYYTGDGEPRSTNYLLATAGGVNYPMHYYTLGLPKPVVAPTIAAVSFTAIVGTNHRSRDAGNFATITTAAAHGLATGAYVTISGATDTTFNLTNTPITVTSATTFTYYCPGAAVVDALDAALKVSISGALQRRSYIYTWVTSWGEESVPSDPSNAVYVNEGQTINVTGLPAAWPGSYTGTYQSAAYPGDVSGITGPMTVRIYRSVSSTAGAAYYLVAEQALGVTTYTDTTATNALSVQLPSLYYDQPPAAMQGIRAIHNGMLVGFYGNVVCFSEPGQPHAWPVKYQQNLDSPVVAVNNIGQTVVVLTTRQPWVIQGNSPSVMAKTKMDYLLPCTSKRAVVNMGFGLVFPTPGGLAIYSASTGADSLTKFIHDWDTWSVAVDGASLVATQANGRYYACSNKGSFVFEKNDQVGGYLVELSQAFSAAYYDAPNAKLYYATGTNTYLWDDPAQALGQMDWKSKVMKTKEPINLGAARVIADYGMSATDLINSTTNNATAVANQAIISGLPLAAQKESLTYGPLGSAAFGATGVSATGVALGAAVAGASSVEPLGASDIQAMIPINAGVQFQLFVDKSLVFVAAVTDSNTFRLPTGYRSDTFEVRVTGTVRVRAIHLAETPYGLKQV